MVSIRVVFALAKSDDDEEDLLLLVPPRPPPAASVQKCKSPPVWQDPAAKHLNFGQKTRR